MPVKNKISTVSERAKKVIKVNVPYEWVQFLRTSPILSFRLTATLSVIFHDIGTLPTPNRCNIQLRVLSQMLNSLAFQKSIYFGIELGDNESPEQSAAIMGNSVLSLLTIYQNA